MTTRRFNNLQDLRDEIRNHLRDYLEIMGVNFVRKDFFLCINPTHQDGSPSCHIVPHTNESVFKCFGCQCSGDIFHASHFLERKPLVGPEFIEDNLYYLADKLGLDYDKERMITPEMRVRFDFYHIFCAAGAILCTDAANKKYAEARGWKKGTCEALGIGSIAEDSLAKRINRDTGLDVRDLQRPPVGIYGILGGGLFGLDFLTFSIFDWRGNVIGFQSRDIKYVPPTQTSDGQRVEYPGPKYCNSIDSPIYHKKDVLNGIHLAIASRREDLWIFEGTGSWVTAYQAGLKNSCTTCGTAITPEMLDLAHARGFRTLHFCPDADQAGTNAIMKLGMDAAPVLALFRVTVTQVPKGSKLDQKDADWYIQNHGIEKFSQLGQVPLFEWMLSKMDLENKPEEVAMQMIPLIVADPSPVSWSGKIQILSENTGISADLIKLQAARLVDNQEREVKDKETIAVQKMIRDIQHGAAPIQALEQTLAELTAIGSKRSNDTDILNNDRKIADLFDEIEGVTNIEDRWQTSNWMMFDSVFDGGFPKMDCLMAIGGLPQQGKSAFMWNYAVELLRAGANRNLLLYVMSIDESAKQILPKLIAAYSRMDLSIGDCSHPKRIDPQKFQAYEECRDIVVGWVQDRRLLITDHMNDDSLAYAVETCKAAQQLYPDRQVLFMLDNFHKLRIPGTDERLKFKLASETFHALSVRNRFSIIVTAELNKEAHGLTQEGRRPRLKDLSETGKLEYDCNAIGLAYNEMEMKKFSSEKCSFYWTHVPDDDRPDARMPVFELSVEKNKITSVKRRLYFKFTPDFGYMEPISRDEVFHRRRE